MLALVGTARGATIYAASYTTDSLYLIDTQAGSVDCIGAFGADFTEGGLALDSAGVLYGSFTGADDQLYTIDTNTGVAGLVGPFGLADVSGIAFGPDDALFGIDSASDDLITINAATGTGMVFGDGSTGITGIGAVAGTAFGPNDTLYLVDSANQALYEFQDILSGDDTATLLCDLGLERTAGLTFALDGGEMRLFVVDSGVGSELYSIDLDTYAVEAVALSEALPVGVGGLAGVVPEPATLALLGVGALGLLNRRRDVGR